MSEVKVVTKNLAGLEDFAIGVGTLQQARAGSVVQVSRARIPKAVSSTAELGPISSSIYQYAVVVDNTGAVTYYTYSATDNTGVPSTSGPGSWLPEKPENIVNLINTIVNEAIEDTLANKFDWVTPEEFGAIGDGVADDSAAFTAALATGKNVHCKPKANYKADSTIEWPWSATGNQTIYGYGCTITTNNTRVPVFRQRLADNSTDKITVRKNYYEVNLVGPVRTKDIFASISGTDGFWLKDGKLINCSAVGYSTGCSAMGNVTVQAFYADKMRNAGLRAEGSYNRVYGLFANWTAGDVLIIKSDYSYYADVYGEYAGVIPSDTLEPGPQQGSLISFAQDGANAGGNLVNGAGCRYYGAGAITINGENNHVGGVIDIGKPADTSFAAVDRYDPAFYIAGTNCSLGDATANMVYGGVHLHNGSVNCHVGMIDLGTVSDLNSNCQALVAAGTCTNCKIDGVIASGVAKPDGVFVSMADLYIGTIRLRAMNMPQLAAYPIRILGSATIDNLDVDVNLTSTSTSNTAYFGAAARINNFRFSGAFGGAFVVENNVNPLFGDMYINPRAGNTSRIGTFVSSDASATRYIKSLTIVGSLQPRGNGTIVIGSYRGNVWLRDDAAQTLSVSYPDTVAHAIP